MVLKYAYRSILLFGCVFLLANITIAQMITGVWKGRINKQKVEIKIIQQGDSLTGTSYYYESPSHYRRYSIKGYFNSGTNEAVWWDDQLIEEKTGKLNLSSPGKNPMLSSADFNCPGDGRMMLDGTAGKKEDSKTKGEVHLDKIPGPDFEDEWDMVIENYTVGGNDPELIDSIEQLAHKTPTNNFKLPKTEEKHSNKDSDLIAKKPMIAIISSPAPEKIIEKPVVIIPEPVAPLTIEEKFVTRKKILTKEIPLSGDSIELRFYDNAEIDGDSISLFLNDQLIFSHIRLTGNAYSIKLPVASLNETNELIMVAENLGSIPPNTSYMVALVGDNRYEARLESTEGSSAMVRFVKKKENQ